MAKGILYVESRPSSSDREAEYHAFYERRLAEIVALDGFVAARRFASFDDGPFVAIYEIEADDLEAVQAHLADTARSGNLPLTEAMETDPMPVSRLLREITAYPPTR